MDELLTAAFLSSLLTGAIVAGIPILLAGLGEQMSEKAGVLNIGIEGMMIFGAYLGFLTAWSTESLWLGFLGRRLCLCSLAPARHRGYSTMRGGPQYACTMHVCTASSVASNGGGGLLHKHLI